MAQVQEGPSQVGAARHSGSRDSLAPPASPLFPFLTRFLPDSKNQNSTGFHFQLGMVYITRITHHATSTKAFSDCVEFAI